MYDLIIFLVLLGLGYFVGQALEKSHFRSIIKREKELRHLLTFSNRYPPSVTEEQNAQLVSGSVVISIDYFKQIVAALRALIGGRITSYESLLERARREALLRMKEEALTLGANIIVNVKLETSSITKGQRQQVGCVEVLAYGTALHDKQFS